MNENINVIIMNIPNGEQMKNIFKELNTAYLFTFQSNDNELIE